MNDRAFFMEYQVMKADFVPLMTNNGILLDTEY